METTTNASENTAKEMQDATQAAQAQPVNPKSNPKPAVS